MKMFNVSLAIWPYMKNVLERDDIIYSVHYINHEKLLLDANISARRFTEVMEDTLCEKQRETTRSKVPVYSYRTLKNKDKRKRLINLNGKTGFHVYSKDIKKCKSAGLI